MSFREEDGKRRCEHSLVCVLEEPNSINEIASFINVVYSLQIDLLCIVSKSKYIGYSWKGDRMLTKLTNTANNKIKIKSFSTSIGCIRYLGKHNYACMIASQKYITKRIYPLETTDFSNFRRVAVWFSHNFSDEIIINSVATIRLKIIRDIGIEIDAGIILHWLKSESKILYY